MDRRSFLETLSGALGAFVFGAPGPKPAPGSKAKPTPTPAAKDTMTWRAWGQNSKGELADGATDPAFPPIYPPVLSTVPVNATAYGGQDAGIAVTPAGDLYVWGNNSVTVSGTPTSRFGNQFGSTAALTTATKLTYTDAVNATSAACDPYAAFWLRSDHTLWAIGLNHQGQFGNGEVVETYHATPTQIASNVASFAAPDGSASPSVFYIDLSGNVWVAGDQTYGQLGDGTSTPFVKTTTFTQIAALTSVDRLWTSGNHTYTLSGSTLKTWGQNQWGELGIGNNTLQTSPVTVTTLPGGSTVSDILACAYGPFTYVLLTDGRLYVAGFGGAGSLGLGNGYLDVNTLTQATVGASLLVTALAQTVRATSGSTSSGAVVAGGKYWSTGPNDSDQVDPSSFASYETFQNLITLPAAITAITFLGDKAVFVKVPQRARAFAQVVG